MFSVLLLTAIKMIYLVCGKVPGRLGSLSIALYETGMAIWGTFFAFVYTNGIRGLCNAIAELGKAKKCQANLFDTVLLRERNFYFNGPLLLWVAPIAAWITAVTFIAFAIDGWMNVRKAIIAANRSD